MDGADSGVECGRVGSFQELSRRSGVTTLPVQFFLNTEGDRARCARDWVRACRGEGWTERLHVALQSALVGIAFSDGWSRSSWVTVQFK